MAPPPNQMAFSKQSKAGQKPKVKQIYAKVPQVTEGGGGGEKPSIKLWHEADNPKSLSTDFLFPRK